MTTLRIDDVAGRLWEVVVRRVDRPLFSIALAIVGVGFVTLFSAADQSVNRMVNQGVSLCVALVAMWVIANIPPQTLSRVALPLYAAGVVLLVGVALFGVVVNGSRRWLDLGVIRFQPSEIMKLAVPMTCAWWLHERPLPPSWSSLAVLAGIILLPTGLTIMQPDLGTGGLIMIGGMMVVIMAGLQFRIIFSLAALGALAGWLAWQYVLYDYQKQRVFTLLDPESDKLGAGYHIIQSQIAIGSGGVFGKGLLNGSQGQLEFLPERTTDFIFAMVGEELGLVGAAILMLLYLFVVGRALYLAVETQDTFARLLAGSIALTFFVYVFINTGMVSGLLPVVGVPLPLVSYGGTSMVTLLAGFGILMSLYSHRKLVAS